MPIISIEFALFFVLFFALYWSFRASPRIQNGLLLVAGLGWLFSIHWGFALNVIAFALVVNIVGIRIHSAQSLETRKSWLIFGVSLILLGLATFKYYDFYRFYLQEWLGDNLVDVLLPLGISYYAFQSISYLVDLYKERGLKMNGYHLLLNFSFFPTITAGPIFRINESKSILGVHKGAGEQICQTQPRNIILPALAVTLILLGIAKKWWLSGTLADNWVSPVFENPMQYDFWNVLIAIYGYTLQLFLDFSGYTDLVIGMAMLLGFQLPPNFAMPLIAHNIRDFWNRWHISLSTWIRDYIYIPLGGSRKGFIRTQLNLFIAMVLSGIWHGYGWNFFIWGCLHGIALVLLNIGDALFKRRNALSTYRLGKIIGIVITLHFVCFSFVIFHTNTLDETQLVFVALFQGLSQISMPMGTTAIMLALLMLLFVNYSIIVKLIELFTQLLDRLPIIAWVVPLLAILLLITIFAPSGIPGFIYANF